MNIIVMDYEDMRKESLAEDLRDMEKELEMWLMWTQSSRPILNTENTKEVLARARELVAELTGLAN